MQIKDLELEGIKIYIPNINEDQRGSFVEKLNISQIHNFHIKQINQSVSHKNVFRGFHFQSYPKEQSKYVWVENGRIFDIVINIKKNSKDYKKSIIIELSDKNNNHLFIPKGFAHGFISLENNTKVCYAVDDFYDSEFDSGINYMDNSFSIDWPVDINDLIISEKDKNLPFLKND